MRPPVDPVGTVLACAGLTCLTAGLGMLVTFRGLFPWHGVAVVLIIAACILGWRGALAQGRPRDEDIR